VNVRHWHAAVLLAALCATQAVAELRPPRFHWFAPYGSTTSTISAGANPGAVARTVMLPCPAAERTMATALP